MWRRFFHGDFLFWNIWSVSDFFRGLCRGIFRDTISGHAYIRKRCFSQNIQSNINASSRRGWIMLWGIQASFSLNWWNVVCGQKAGLISIFTPCKGIPKQSWILDCRPVIENFRGWIPVFISAIPDSNRWWDLGDSLLKVAKGMLHFKAQDCRFRGQNFSGVRITQLKLSQFRAKYKVL